MGLLLEDKYKNFDEFYSWYLSQHQNVNNRRMHLLGVLTTLGFIATVLLTGLNLWWLLLAPLIVYPFAWTGHLVLEGNRPAAWNFRRTLPSKVADIRMCTDMLVGNIPL